MYYQTLFLFVSLPLDLDFCIMIEDYVGFLTSVIILWVTISLIEMLMQFIFLYMLLNIEHLNALIMPLMFFPTKALGY